MTTRTRTAAMKKLALLLLLVPVACSPGPESSAKPTSSPASSPEQALCFAEVPGKNAVDVELRAARAAALAPPARNELLIKLGQAFVKKARNDGDPGFYLHADACAKLVLEARPGDAAAENLRALALLNDHRFAEARDLAKAMLVRDRDDTMALGTLSDALLELGDVEGAEAAAQAMMDKKPNLPSYARASYLKWLRGDVDGALQAIRLAHDAGRGQKDHEPSAWVLTEAADIFWKRGDVAGAAAGYEMALREKPDHAPALAGRGRCLVANERFVDAVAAFDASLGQAPLTDTAWWLSKARTAAGDVAGATIALDKAIALGRTGDRRSLALLLATLDRDLAEAAKAADDDAASRGGVYADDVVALMRFRSGDLPAALAASARALALGTPEPRFLLHRGVILRASGDAAGQQLIDDALARGLRFDPAAVALARPQTR